MKMRHNGRWQGSLIANKAVWQRFPSCHRAIPSWEQATPILIAPHMVCSSQNFTVSNGSLLAPIDSKNNIFVCIYFRGSTSVFFLFEIAVLRANSLCFLLSMVIYRCPRGMDISFIQ